MPRAATGGQPRRSRAGLARFLLRLTRGSAYPAADLVPLGDRVARQLQHGAGRVLAQVRG